MPWEDRKEILKHRVKDQLVWDRIKSELNINQLNKWHYCRYTVLILLLIVLGLLKAHLILALAHSQLSFLQI
ncbi:hypothetical protein G293_00545 [Candidatus Liberibacter africanus PTSAPSY]|uniref:Uncharacterized protein n=1 Tax=Candidatus Liberibacter africanus PTSAPSY TaxID=1277257 RepID=A0A0G3I3C9_LIBAF|nr:hypothetical protein G293_00545 [Candidatus Liberibacter africanus PTSAPSY]